MRKFSKKWLVLGGTAILLLAAVPVILWCWLKDPEPTMHELMAAAIEKTEARDSFTIQICSTGTVSVGDVSQTVQTSGYLYTQGDKDYTSIYVNTSSDTENAEAADFDVTVAMYCDGEHVYDNTGAAPVRMDMSCQEFQQIVSEYGLYHYDPADATDITYSKNEKEGYNGGQYSVTLAKPSDEVLVGYAGVLSEATGQTVAKEDLQVLSAYVLYSVYDGEVVTQTCSFTVSCTMADGREAYYSAVNQVAYLQSPDQAVTEEETT